ncbi:hypothetical protein NE237_002200 [Protea cynaroides]|uniref:Uncharacterized protein n=1 Tax=Protea cynaroides TaxID=273540 RepID=A0A9Q0KVN3_9MAGN|nr:hypothetical protein NE237_002200 [Protea cynaroides]
MASLFLLISELFHPEDAYLASEFSYLGSSSPSSCAAMAAVYSSANKRAIRELTRNPQEVDNSAQKLLHPEDANLVSEFSYLCSSSPSSCAAMAAASANRAIRKPAINSQEVDNGGRKVAEVLP